MQTKLTQTLLIILAMLSAIEGSRQMSFAAPCTPIVYDIRPLAQAPQSLAQRQEAYQTLHALAALQGIVNSSSPRLMFAFSSNGSIDNLEMWWYEQARALPIYADRLGTPTLVTYPNVPPCDFIKDYLADLQGLVVWDPATPATALVASALAGQMHLIPVTPAAYPGSLLNKLTALGLSVKMDLSQMTPPAVTGSAKCDWYHWLASERMQTERRHNSDYVAYYVDGYAMNDTQGHWGSIGLINHDYVISKGGFFVDLSMWGDEAPCDDPTQPLGADEKTFNAFLDRLRADATGDVIRGFGFSPWMYKYSDHHQRGLHSVVDGEWRFVDMFSRRNIIVAESDATAMVDFANGSFWQHFALEEPCMLNDPARGRIQPEPGKRYLCWLMGDYDSSAWMAQMLPERWNDPQRGRLPLAWMANPVCFERAPHIARVLQAQRSPLDAFVAYEGLGYDNPNQSPDLKALVRGSKPAFEKYGYSIIGYMINPPTFWITPQVAAAYAQLAPGGMGLHPGALFRPRKGVCNGAPIIESAWFTDFNENDADKAAKQILANDASAGDFLLIRTIQVTPTFVTQVMARLNEKEEKYQALDPYTFFELVKQNAEQAKSQNPAR